MSKCVECRYFLRVNNNNGNGKGKCRRNAPIIFIPNPIASTDKFSYSQPVVDDNDWCGEFSNGD